MNVYENNKNKYFIHFPCAVCNKHHLVEITYREHRTFKKLIGAGQLILTCNDHDASEVDIKENESGLVMRYTFVNSPIKIKTFMEE